MSERVTQVPRKEKTRSVGTIPEYTGFLPDGISNGEMSVLTVDEFETIRLIDLEKQNQEQAAEKMGVARTTVTAIYERARYKLADSVVNGKRLLIEGGNFRCCAAACPKMKKGEDIMRIAVTYENGEIFQHFGKTEQFKLYDIEDGAIKSTQVVGTNGAGHGALAGFLKQAQADVLICGGIGGGAQMAMAESGIKLYGGNSGSADEAVNAFLSGALAQNENPTCDHHGHGEGHSCGDHGCH